MIINSTRFFISCRRRWKKKDCEEVGVIISHQIYSELKKLQTSNFPKRNHFLCLKGNTESHDHKNMSSSIIDQCSYIAIPMLSLCCFFLLKLIFLTKTFLLHQFFNSCNCFNREIFCGKAVIRSGLAGVDQVISHQIYSDQGGEEQTTSLAKNKI